MAAAQVPLSPWTPDKKHSDRERYFLEKLLKIKHNLNYFFVISPKDGFVSIQRTLTVKNLVKKVEN